MNIIKKFTIYLFSIICLATASCSDDIIDDDIRIGEGKPCKGTLTLNVDAGAAALSTRSVNMNDGATVKINSLWIGVFDKANGQCIGKTRIDGFDKTVTAGTPSRNTVTVDFFSNRSNPEVYVVGVANYEEVVTTGEIPLIDAVQAAATWDDLVKIDVDAVSAYAGNKGENAISQEPFLMGYYLESTGLSRVPKFDQFEQEGEGITVYPENAATAMTVKLYTDEEGDLYVPSGALTLRRLVSNVNVKLAPGPGIEISDVSYMAFNKPQSSYLVQRRTDTTSGRGYREWQENSPNRSDCFVAENGESSDSYAYKNDENWRTDISADGLGFSFQHFENKHWGFGDIRNFSDRENRNSDGTLKALSPNGTSPYNDHASYFKIKMHITDRNTGRSGEVIYTIHEGMCNTDDGRKADSDEVKMKDYGSFRNTNYTYTVNVNGMEKIVVNASLDEDSEDYNHGQEGQIWQIVYANGNGNFIPDAGGTFGDIELKPNAVPAFRIFWQNMGGEPVDFCYNFPEKGETMLGGFWPEKTNSTVFSNNIADIKNLPTEILSQISVTDGTTDYTLEEFISDFERISSINPSGHYKFKFKAYEGPWEDEPKDNVRGLYLFDKNEFYVNKAGTSSYGKIYVAEQCPLDVRPTKSFNTSNVIWHTAFHTTTESKWCGCVNSIVDVSFAHDSQFEGYFIECQGVRQKIGKEKLSDYIKTVNGKQAVVYPFPTDKIAGSENAYDVIITPITKDKAYKGAPTTVSKSMGIYPTKWIVNSTPLIKDMDIGKKTLIDVEYRGLEIYQNHTTANSSVKGSYISFGGSSNITDRVLRFYTVKSGKLTVQVCSNATLPSGAASNSIDTSRYMSATMVKYDENGNQIELNKISLESQYVPYANRTENRVFDIVIDEPCYIYVTMTGGNIRVYGITFEPY